MDNKQNNAHPQKKKENPKQTLEAQKYKDTARHFSL